MIVSNRTVLDAWNERWELYRYQPYWNSI